MTYWRENFLGKIRRGISGCILWTGATNQKGYGRFKVDGRLVPAHHASWFLKYGKWPVDKLLHRCDVPSCVKPSHLFEGSQDDNMKDKCAKGRQLRGEQINRSKLMQENVREIRRLCIETNMTYAEISERFGISLIHTYGIHTRRYWSWLDKDQPVGKKQTRGQVVRDLSTQSGLKESTIRE